MFLQEGLFIINTIWFLS